MQIVNLCGEIAVKNFGCFFAYFCGRYKNKQKHNYNFIAPSMVGLKIVKVNLNIVGVNPFVILHY